MKRPKFLFIPDPLTIKQEIGDKLNHYKTGENPTKRNIFGEVYPTKTSLLRRQNPQQSLKQKSKKMQIEQNQTNFNSENIRKEKTALMEMSDLFKGNIVNAINSICTQNFKGIFNEFIPQLEFLEENRNLQLFKKHIHFLAQFAFVEKYTDQSCFLFKQLLGMAEVSKDRYLKVKSLIGIAQCAVKIKQYKYAIEIYKKALQYAWVLENQKLELIIFDQLGLCYFYEGNINQARFYHHKYMNNEIEPLKGYFRNMSEKQIQFYEQTIQNTTDSIDQILMLKVSLPIINFFDPKQGKADEFKTVTIISCSCLGVVDQVINSYELKNFRFDYFSERTKREEQFEFRPIPKYILEIKNRYKEKKKLSFSMHQKILPYEDIIYQINRTLRSNSHKLGELQEQTYMRHILKQDSSNQEIRMVKQLTRLKLLLKQCQ